MWFVNLEIRYFVHQMEYFIHIISVYHTQTKPHHVCKWMLSRGEK